MSAHRLLVTAAVLVLASWALCQDDQPAAPAASQPADAPVDVLWQVQFGTADKEQVHGLAIDDEGNCYVAGLTITTEAREMAIDISLCKYGRGGQLLWSRNADMSDMSAIAMGIALDTEGNCFVVGWVFGGDLGPTSDAFVMKYDAEGELVWLQDFGSDEEDHAYGIAVDSEGNSYICGVTSGDMTGSGSEPSSRDIFVVKYDADGSEVWVRQFGSDADDRARAIAVAEDGIIYVTGATKGDIGGDNQGGEDAFIVYLDSEGEWLSGEQFGSAQDDDVRDIVVDADGNCYVVGQTEGELTGGVGEGEIFIAKYDADLVQLWLMRMGGELPARPTGLALDPTGGLLVAGAVVIEKGGAPGEEKVDPFLLKCDLQGQQEWLWQFTSDESDFAGDVAVDADGNYYLGGGTYGALAGDHQGDSDAYIMVLSPTDSSSADEAVEDGPDDEAEDAPDDAPAPVSPAEPGALPADQPSE